MLSNLISFVLPFQDLLMVTYLSNLTQAQIALNEKLVLLWGKIFKMIYI